jgi:hypothetical protein
MMVMMVGTYLVVMSQVTRRLLDVFVCQIHWSYSLKIGYSVFCLQKTAQEACMSSAKPKVLRRKIQMAPKSWQSTK